MVASFVEGRIRIRHISLKNQDTLGKAVETLKANNGIELIKPNRNVGSLLVFYDKALTKTDEILDALHSYLWEKPIIGKNKTPNRKSGIKRPQAPISKRQAVNIGLIASLSGSLLALLVNAKTAHVQLGILFTITSLIHIYDNKKTLLK